MITNELLQYVQAEFGKGVPLSLIKERLQTQGWLPSDIEEATSKLGIQPAAPQQNSAPMQSQTSAAFSQNPSLYASPSSPSMQAEPIQPVAQPISMPPPGFETPSQPKHSRKGKIILVIVIILILIAAGGAGAYAYFTGYFVSLDKVTNEAFTSARSATSATTDTTVTLTMPISDTSTDTETGSLTVKGSYDLSDKTDPKFSANVAVNFGNTGGAAELRMVNKTLYGQLTNVSNAGLLASFLNTYLNKWYSFDYTGPDGSALLSQLPLPSIATEGSSSLSSLTDDQKAHLLQLTNDAHFITIVKRLQPEKISGVLSYDFTFDLDRPGITAYVNAVTTYIHSIGANDSQLSSFDMSDTLTQLADISNFSGEAWIGIGDHLPYKVSLSFDSKDDSDAGVAKVSLVSIFSDWNKPVTVDVPPNSVPIETLIDQLMSGGEDASAQSADAAAEGNVSSMRALSAEYQSNQGTLKGFCTSSDAEDTISQIKSSGVAAADIVCKDSAAAFAISAKLSDGSYACADSTGAMVEEDKPITGTSCPTAN